ncbi:hypothetical protein ACFOKI_01850 [Sphingomonas qilianensis]|uniref:ATPase n=1 Tax=Sphingomonas qilianensis TaxID=1736690 RepID=A0ABU9XTY3_9SPHN
MNGGSRIINIRSSGGRAVPDSDLLLEESILIDTPDFPAEMYDTDAEAPDRRGWIFPLLGLLVSLGWIAGMLALCWPQLGAITPVELAGFIAALCVPPALIGVLLLLGLRTSTAEARRFGRTAQAMRAEAAALERTVGMLSHAIDANRVRLAEQATELLALGDHTAASMASTTAGLNGQIADTAAHAQTLADAAAATHAKLDVLMSLLPRAHRETVDIGQALDRAGTGAATHAGALDAQLQALAERGRDAEALAQGAAQQLVTQTAQLEASGKMTSARIEQVTGQMTEAVDALLDRTAEALDETRKRIAGHTDATFALFNANQAAIDRAVGENADALSARVAAVDVVIDRIAARLRDQRSAGEAFIGTLDGDITHVSRRLDSLHAQGVERSQHLAASISALGGSAEAMTEALQIGDVMATNAIATTEQLLVALDAAAREIDETLPDALARLDARIGESRRIVGAVTPELLSLVGTAESTHDAVAAIAGVLSAQRDTIERLSASLLETLTEGRAKASELGDMVDETIGRSNRFADEAAPRLIETLIRVRDTASVAADRARETLVAVIPEAAAALEQASAAAIERASGTALRDQLSAIGQAAANAADAATRASERLTQQLATIVESTAQVDQRIDAARSERDAADTDTLARRVSLLIEALNSASIDIAKAFSTDVTDSAWAAYLKGDRGVFTRRAVRLIDASDAREIVRLYDDDDAFRDQVNRYIHDFEAMLRAILAQRDGSPLGVTLLSSDMGKLYVALAQAIARLRT